MKSDQPLTRNKLRKGHSCCTACITGQLLCSRSFIAKFIHHAHPDDVDTCRLHSSSWCCLVQCSRYNVLRLSVLACKSPFDTHWRFPMLRTIVILSEVLQRLRVCICCTCTTFYGPFDNSKACSCRRAVRVRNECVRLLRNVLKVSMPRWSYGSFS